MAKNRLIIIEGANGVGKTTLANYLREKMPFSNLYRLNSQKDKTIKGKNDSFKMYQALLKYLKELENVKMDLIFDRMFFSEEIYAKLGYKDYDYTDAYNSLLKELNNLDYEIYLFILYLEDVSLYKSRLERKEHYKIKDLNYSSSIKLQEEYLKLNLENSNIKVSLIKMDNPNLAYEKIKNILEGE